MIRIAFIVSHPIQYYAPLHRWLAKRDDVQVKVFFTWHGGESAQFDAGFKKAFSWDIPLLEGYESQVVPNTNPNPGTNHFFGLTNPTLVKEVLAWKPDVVHLTGYANYSHLVALWEFSRRGIPVFHRGDSHLLDDPQKGPRWLLKRTLLSIIFSWPAACLYVGRANCEYYRRFGVPEKKLVHCPHSIEIDRFAEPEQEWETQAREWRRELQIPDDTGVLLFAGKFEDKKRPVPLMEAFLKSAPERAILLMVGDGVYGDTVRELAAKHPERFRVLPFQNQSRMPVVYRLGDWLVLPSAYNETWGLAVNEAMACGRPALVSDHVGCHFDLIQPGVTGQVFHADDWADFGRKLESLPLVGDEQRRKKIRAWAQNWSIEKTAEAIIKAANEQLHR